MVVKICWCGMYDGGRYLLLVWMWSDYWAVVFGIWMLFGKGKIWFIDCLLGGEIKVWWFLVNYLGVCLVAVE